MSGRQVRPMGDARATMCLSPPDSPRTRASTTILRRRPAGSGPEPGRTGEKKECARPEEEIDMWHWYGMKPCGYSKSASRAVRSTSRSTRKGGASSRTTVESPDRPPEVSPTRRSLSGVPLGSRKSATTDGPRSGAAFVDRPGMWRFGPFGPMPFQVDPGQIPDHYIPKITRLATDRDGRIFTLIGDNADGRMVPSDVCALERRRKLRSIIRWGRHSQPPPAATSTASGTFSFQSTGVSRGVSGSARDPLWRASQVRSPPTHANPGHNTDETLTTREVFDSPLDLLLGWKV